MDQDGLKLFHCDWGEATKVQGVAHVQKRAPNYRSGEVKLANSDSTRAQLSYSGRIFPTVVDTAPQRRTALQTSLTLAIRRGRVRWHSPFSQRALPSFVRLDITSHGLFEQFLYPLVGTGHI